MTCSSSDLNKSLPDVPLYGDVLVRGVGRNEVSRSFYRSLSKYCVQMGLCSIDRDVWALQGWVTNRNIDINKQTRKFMKDLSKYEIYAVRRVGTVIACYG